MFKHILLPTDGTAATRRAVRKGIRLARVLGARVTGIYVAPPYPLIYAADGMAAAAQPPPTQYRRDVQETAKKYLGRVAEVARKAGVPCATLCVTNDRPYTAIMKKTARSKKCDLIVMRASSRKPLSLRLFESETRKVLGRSNIPLLILH